MRCSTVRTLLDDHASGVLPAERSSQVRAHLDACSDCEQELELLRAVTAPLSAWGDLEPPAGCFDRILERIEALPPEMHVPAPPPPRPALRVLQGGTRWLLTSAAAAAAVFVAAATLDGGSEAPQHDQRIRMKPVAGASVNAMLKDGEIPLTRVHTRFAITDDLEQRDGLRRRRERRDASPDLAVPVSADPLGAGPR
jgi:anti-sigma factor RsiW